MSGGIMTNWNRAFLFSVGVGFACLVGGLAQAQISSFSHIIVVVQENRTPDNLFQGLCSPPYGTSSSCSTTPTGSQYDIQTSNWLNKSASGGVTQPSTIALANTYDLGHTHTAFNGMCDLNKSGACAMDGDASNVCTPNTGTTCPTLPEYMYVDNSTGILNPYLSIATQYGWSNYMFQTNQGPSYPAHQFIFGGTSAPSAADDAAGTYAAENVSPNKLSTVAGCIALESTTVLEITTVNEKTAIYPCFEHETLSDLMDSADLSWKYYTPSTGSIWTAPNSIDHICVPSEAYGGTCTGTDWVDDVVINPSKVLTEISKCDLPALTWVIPTGGNSDHAGINTGGGPSWVASIVNQVGNNGKCKSGENYWDDTAIIITWDDWGGWYDHEPPTFLAQPYGDYQYGFRVPLMVVSGYTAAGYVDNTRSDFGSILRFIEQNFGIAEGALGFADARSTTNLTEFFNLTQPARVFTTIPTALDANYFINDKTPPTDPDDD
jgi:phospholipase C